MSCTSTPSPLGEPPERDGRSDVDPLSLSSLSVPAGEDADLSEPGEGEAETEADRTCVHDGSCDVDPTVGAAQPDRPFAQDHAGGPSEQTGSLDADPISAGHESSDSEAFDPPRAPTADDEAAPSAEAHSLDADHSIDEGRRTEPEDDLARLAELEDELAGYAGIINGTHGALVELVGAVLDGDLWEGLVGVHSPAHWLAWRAGLHLNQAKGIVLIARRRHELPVTVAALAAGELSLEQARLIAKHAPSAFDASVCNFAKYQTIPQLTRNLRDYSFDPDGTFEPDAAPSDHDSETGNGSGRAGAGDGADAGRSDDEHAEDGRLPSEGSGTVSPADEGSDPTGEGSDPTGDSTGDGSDPTGHPDGEGSSASTEAADGSSGHDDGGDGRSDADDADEAGWASWWWDDNSRCRLSAVLPADLAMVLTTALDASRSDLLAQTRAELPKGAAMPWISDSDALLNLARSYLAGGRENKPGSDRYTLFAHLETTPSGRSGTRAHLGPRLPDHLAELLSCDNGIRPVWEVHGRPLSVGRTQHIVPDRARRLIEHRDGGCVIPGCTRTTNLDIHHIVHWEHGGPTDTYNLVCLCRRHHRQHHLGKIRVSGNADVSNGLTFTDRHGRPLPSGPTPRPMRSDHSPDQAARDMGVNTVPYEHGPGMRTDGWAVHLSPEPPSSPPAAADPPPSAAADPLTQAAAGQPPPPVAERPPPPAASDPPPSAAAERPPPPAADAPPPPAAEQPQPSVVTQPPSRADSPTEPAPTQAQSPPGSPSNLHGPPEPAPPAGAASPHAAPPDVQPGQRDQHRTQSRNGSRQRPDRPAANGEHATARADPAA